MTHRFLLDYSSWSTGLAPNNSFKPTPHRGVNSALYATLHAVAAPLRGGLTQALGRMSHNPYSPPKSNMSPSRVTPRTPRLWVKLTMTLGGLVFGIAASFVVANIFVALTYSCDAGPCDAGSYVGAGLAIILPPFLVSYLQLWATGLPCVMVGGVRPNNSFKPTPCRGVGHVLYATLAHVRRPATGRLNSGVRRQKSV